MDGVGGRSMSVAPCDRVPFEKKGPGFLDRSFGGDDSDELISSANVDDSFVNISQREHSINSLVRLDKLHTSTVQDGN